MSPDGAVWPDSTEANAIADRGIAECSLKTFSEGLHPLQDSWSHQGIPFTKGVGHWRGVVQTADGYTNVSGTWRAAASESADSTDYWPADARKAAMATYKKLLGRPP